MYSSTIPPSRHSRTPAEPSWSARDPQAPTIATRFIGPELPPSIGAPSTTTVRAPPRAAAMAADEPAAPPAADELGPVVVIASIHGKASAAIETFVPALKDALAAAAPDAATFALGMDSNAPDGSFRAALERAGLSFELAGAPERRTVCKRRTAF